MVVILNDWAHLSRKVGEGLLDKRMKNIEHLGFVKLCINDLRLAPTVAAFEALRDFVLDAWRRIGEGDVAKYFEKTYLKDPWEKWFIGATPAGVGTSGQQGIENNHRGDKAVLGKQQLRAAPKVFIEKSVPTILMTADDKLDRHPPRSVSHRGKGPIHADVVTKAQLLMRIEPASYKLQSVDGTEYWTFNKTTAEDRKMTATRGNAYGDFYDVGKLPAFPSACNPEQAKEHYKKVHRNVLEAVVVGVSAVAERSQLAAWAQHLGDLYKPLDGVYYELDCSCPAWSHTANRCEHVVACASQLGIIQLAALLDGVSGRRGVGRPRTEGGCLSTTSTAPKRDAAAFLKLVNNAPAMRFHKHNVAQKKADGEIIIGWLRSLIDAGSDTVARKYGVTFPDETDESLRAQVWSPAQLAYGLFLAYEMGIGGPKT